MYMRMLEDTLDELAVLQTKHALGTISQEGLDRLHYLEMTLFESEETE